MAKKTFAGFTSLALTAQVCAGILLGLSVPYALAAAPTCNGVTATIYVEGGIIKGGPDDGDTYTGTLDGTNGADVIVGTSGNDIIDASNGNDIVCGGDGDDEIEGGNEHDTLCGEAGVDTIEGGNGNDTICGGDGADNLDGGNGSDNIDAGAGVDTVTGGGNGGDLCINAESHSDCESTSGTVTCGAGSGVGSTSSAASSAAASSVATSSAASSVSSGAASSATSSAASSASSFWFSIPSVFSSSSSVSSAASSAAAASSDASSASGGASSATSSAGSSAATSSVASSATGGGSSSTTGGGQGGGGSSDLSGIASGGINQGAGSHLGQRTNELFAKVDWLTSGLPFVSVATPTFGGSARVPLSKDELRVVCSMKLSIPTDASSAVVNQVAKFLAGKIDRNEGFVLKQLQDTDLCDEQFASRNVKTIAYLAPEKPLYTNENGRLISQNPTFNACQEALFGSYQLTKQDIQNNPEKDKQGTPRDCAWYWEFSAKTVYFPDYSVYLTLGADGKVTNVPEGYVLVPKAQTVASK